MSQRPVLSRRTLLRAALLAGLGSREASAQAGPFDDRGIGGTGALPGGDEEGDRGIGGTGVIGTIRRFGSIEVNGLRITFPRDVEILIDGRRTRLGRLRLGHIVRVLAEHRGDVLRTRRIEAWSEVVGPVESRNDHGLLVLGQRVLTAGLTIRSRVGETVAVSGLRRLDGAIVASLVVPCAVPVAQVAGVPALDPQGVPRIGDLPLLDLSPDLLGRRILVRGPVSNDGLNVRQAAIEPFGLDLDRAGRFSIEDYVAFSDGRIRVGSGLPVDAGPEGGLLPDEEVRAVVSAVRRDDRFVVDAVKPERNGRGLEHGGPPPGGPNRPSNMGPPGANLPGGPLGPPGTGPGSGEHGSLGPPGMGPPGGPGGFGGPRGGGPGGPGPH